MPDLLKTTNPRGNTGKGVNREIIEYLLAKPSANSKANILDVPCGNGEFLDTVKELFPAWDTTGADIRTPEKPFEHEFILFDAQSEKLSNEHPFDIVTCISGVMEFDNSLLFFEHIHELLHQNGVLIVTNDNLLTVRDRLLYFFSGRFGQYPFQTGRTATTWNVFPVQNLVRILSDAGFEVEKLRYVPILPANWLWIVLAAPLFIFERIFNTSTGADILRKDVFQFRSFLSKHYILVCRRRVT